MKAIAFSKDRPAQLDALLRSLALHAAEPVDVTVIWKASTDRHVDAYGKLIDEGRSERAGLVQFHRERDFEADVRHLLANAGEHVLFLVDDTIFVRGWSPAECVVVGLQNDDEPGVIGVSLRLGMNTSYCYPAARQQSVPTFHQVGLRMIETDLMLLRWPGADGDFSYPLEVSSSIYRTADILSALDALKEHDVGFRNPNELEAALASFAPLFSGHRPWLMAYETSVAVSVPCNRVQHAFANRAGADPTLTSESLLDAWEAEMAIDVDALAGYTSKGAHEEIPLRLVRRESAR